MGTKTKPTSSSSSDTTPRADSSAEKTSSKSSSFSLEPIVKPKIKWSAADLPEISPVAPFLISEDEREAGAASSKQSSSEDDEEEDEEVRIQKMTETTTTTHKHQTFPVDGFENEFTLELMLFEQVTNAKEISDSIKSGSFDVEVALMNPKTIFTENIVRLATFKAIASMETKCMVTRTLHSEIIFNASPKTNINEAFRRFGAGPDSTAILVARVCDKKKEQIVVDTGNSSNSSNSEEHIREKVRKWIDGKEIAATRENLQRFADTNAIKKYYKIDAAELKIASLEDGVLMRIGAREVI